MLPLYLQNILFTRGVMLPSKKIVFNLKRLIRNLHFKPKKMLKQTNVTMIIGEIISILKKLTLKIFRCFRFIKYPDA